MKLTDEEKNSKGFKYFLDKDMELPHTSLSSEIITNQKNATKIKISDFPKEKQEQYEKYQKDQLKRELDYIVSKNTVYVRSFKDGKGEVTTEVTLKPKHNAVKKSLDNLSEDELTQVLRTAQSEATKK